MSEEDRTPEKRNNGLIVAMCLFFVVGMTGMSFAAVPLYRIFCQVTGYNGTISRTEQFSNTILDKKIKVTFDANTAPGLDWAFKADQPSVSPRIGETVQVSFTATNTSDEPVTGQAIFNVTPLQAGAYFNKVECFCFTETELQPGETLDMPVVFFVDPAIIEAEETKDIRVLTLSYTFFEHERPVAARVSEESGSNI
ncbi:cytochrome c oxidase assembly protein [Martelella mediterranea]|uniref:Cytochrome c oxidase assembly protein CtaG n=1 Tax=Martelella mediterranea TaxID=293089 RepID=A0A4R3NR16_9HYPH|nr:cytochrome c oxidase assembly protein [Martelella mediterranea]TCT37320.1 cytochrome c oxidase assembly protein subunit 11 [Martelella mediterranea]